MERYKIGKIIKCQVSGIENYGIFVNVDKDYNGLIHISEITHNFVRNVNDYVNVGDIIYGRIIEIDESEQKMKLSIKDLDYKYSGKPQKIAETEKGFKPLKDMLPKWMQDMMREIED